jgi:hypothetical protein
MELFHNNAGCSLPCFWGFTPGQTEWQTAYPFLDTFAFEIITHSFFAEVYLTASEEVISNFLIQFYSLEDGVIASIEAHVLQTPSYQPSAILNTYGPPTAVWLLTVNAPREGHWGFLMVLFYSQHGFMLEYSGEGTQQDNNVRGCGFEQTKLLLLKVWSPGEELTYPQAVSRTVQFPPTTFQRSLEEATELNIETFYETFKVPGTPLCLETPLNLWPYP